MSPPIVRLDVVPSTQTVAFDLAARGAPDRTVVVAEHQTAGRGRHGRSWLDEPGSSLLVSIVVRPPLPPARWPLYGFVTAVAVAEALGAAGLEARLKWPNDVLVGGAKIAGILLEARGDQALVVGIGLNVGQTAFPAGLADGATSVVLAGGRTRDREVLLEAILAAFDAWRRRLEEDGFEPVRARWSELSETLGRRVQVGAARGRALRLDDDGALVLADGAMLQRVVAGALR
ncbi:MAG: biotin--[acetyl-CoA-carboxylase] ligase [Candidatus Rokubacteria bacterium]|nr:biotin--[acetyl-CoA-carboxylase] ligase [Candidatus Rokubacteria bacterium]